MCSACRLSSRWRTTRAFAARRATQHHPDRAQPPPAEPGVLPGRAAGRAQHPLGGPDAARRARRRRAGCRTDLAAALTEIRETGKARRGDVTIACVPTIGVHYLPQILQRHSADHPQNRVKVLDHSAAVAQAVLTREAEFGINIAESHPPLAGKRAAAGRFRADLPRRPSTGGPRGAALEGAGRTPADLSRRQQQQPALAGSRAGGKPAGAVGLLRGAAQFDGRRAGGGGAGIAVAPRLAWQAGSYPPARGDVAHADGQAHIFVAEPQGAVLSPAAQALHDLILKHGRQAPAGPGAAASGGAGTGEGRGCRYGAGWRP